MTTRWVIEDRQTIGRNRKWRETSILTGIRSDAEARKVFREIIKQRERGWRSRLVRVEIQVVREVLMTEKY